MLSEFWVKSELFGGERRVWIQRPVDGSVVDCVVFLDAELYMERVRAPDIVRDLQAVGQLRGTCCAYLSAPDGACRHREFACNEEFSRFLAMDFRRWLSETTGCAGRFFLCGLSLSGLAVAYAALRHPDAFCGAICQSPSAWWNEEWLAASVVTEGSRRGRFWISVGDKETSSGLSHPPSGMFQGTSQLDSVQRLVKALGGLGDNLYSHLFAGGHDPVCWAKELPEALSWLVDGT